MGGAWTLARLEAGDLERAATVMDRYHDQEIGLVQNLGATGPESDNQIVSEISATDASKRLADILDAVEHRGESFTVVCRGRAIAS